MKRIPETLEQPSLGAPRRSLWVLLPSSMECTNLLAPFACDPSRKKSTSVPETRVKHFSSRSQTPRKDAEEEERTRWIHELALRILCSASCFVSPWTRGGFRRRFCRRLPFWNGVSEVAPAEESCEGLVARLWILSADGSSQLMKVLWRSWEETSIVVLPANHQMRRDTCLQRSHLKNEVVALPL